MKTEYSASTGVNSELHKTLQEHITMPQNQGQNNERRITNEFL